MSTATTNYGFTLPAVADPIDQDLWGTELNTNFSSLDTILGALTANKQGALVVQNSTDSGFSTITSQGTTGQALLSNGPDANPSFGSVASGKTLLATVLAPVASADFTSTYITSSYKEYEIEFINVVMSAGAGFGLRFSQSAVFDNGSNYSCAAGSVGGATIGGAGSNGVNNNTILLFDGNQGISSGSALNGFVKIYDPTAAGVTKSVLGMLKGHLSSNMIIYYFGGEYTANTNACDGAQLLAASGATLTSGTIKLYGIG